MATHEDLEHSAPTHEQPALPTSAGPSPTLLSKWLQALLPCVSDLHDWLVPAGTAFNCTIALQPLALDESLHT